MDSLFLGGPQGHRSTPASADDSHWPPAWPVAAPLCSSWQHRSCQQTGHNIKTRDAPDVFGVCVCMCSVQHVQHTWLCLKEGIVCFVVSEQKQNGICPGVDVLVRVTLTLFLLRHVHNHVDYAMSTTLLPMHFVKLSLGSRFG